MTGSEAALAGAAVSPARSRGPVLARGDPAASVRVPPAPFVAAHGGPSGAARGVDVADRVAGVASSAEDAAPESAGSCARAPEGAASAADSPVVEGGVVRLAVEDADAGGPSFAPVRVGADGTPAGAASFAGRTPFAPGEAVPDVAGEPGPEDVDPPTPCDDAVEDRALAPEGEAFEPPAPWD